MRVLVVGSGGREHALCWKISASSLCDALYCAPGNPGIAAEATNVAIAATDIPGIVAFCTRLETFPLRGQQRDDLLSGLRTIGFEHRITIAFVVTTDAVLIEGIFYGGRDFEAAFQDER